MKINYGALEEVVEALQRMSSLTGKAGYAIMRNLKLLEPEYDIYVKMRNNIILKHAPKGKNGIRPSDPGYQDFVKEYNEFIAREIEVDACQIEPEDYNLDGMYCETAKASDYPIVEALIVKKKDGEPEPVEGKTEGSNP